MPDVGSLTSSNLTALLAGTATLAWLVAAALIARHRGAPGSEKLRAFMWPEFGRDRRRAHARLVVLALVLQAPWLNASGLADASLALPLLIDCTAALCAAWLAWGLSCCVRAGMLLRHARPPAADPGLEVIRLALAWPLWAGRRALSTSPGILGR